LRKKLIDAARRLSKSALSLQVRAGRRDPIALGIENRYPITVVAFVVKCKLVDVRSVPKAEAPCGRKQAAWKRGHDPTNNARDERDQCVAASASGNFDANLAIRERS
jgi:hypothetical protein